MVTGPGSGGRSAIRALARFLARTSTRLVLSGLILASLLPVRPVEQLRLVFFAVFAVEIGVRMLVLASPEDARTRGRRLAVELPFLALDVLATLSFLDWGFASARYLRLFRLSRLVLLVGYWRPFLRDLCAITWQRERRYQIAFVLAVILIGSVAGAAVLQVAAPAAIDYDEDEVVGTADPDDQDFGTLTWWAFRQMQDPGNLVRRPGRVAVVAVSLALTVAGLFLLSFLIAVGTTVVEELVHRGRQRRVGLHDHVVVIGDGPHAHFLLEELVRSQGKQLVRLPIVVFGRGPARPEALEADELSRLHYRHGDAAKPGDLLRADVDRAALVIILADDADGDAGLVSRVLAVRQINEECRVVADVIRATNELSVRAAGGPRTEPVLTRQYVGLALAHELLFPGLDAVLREFLTSRGQELYLAPWPEGRSRTLTDLAGRVGPMLERHGVIPLGASVGGGGDAAGRFVLNPPPGAVIEGATGLLLLARSARQARRAAAELPEPTPPGSPPPAVPTLVVSPELGGLRRLLVCGFREEVGSLIEELGRYRPGLVIRLMVAPGRGGSVRETLLRRSMGLEGAGWRPGGGERGLVLEEHGEERVRLRVFEGDPATDGDLLEVAEADHRLSESDAVLFVADQSWGRDPDAKSALGLLKLFALLRERPDDFTARFRLVGEIQEPGKGDLLEHRFRPSSVEPADRVALVPTEKLRHYLLAQEVFVPGVARLHAELLRERGEELAKLVPAPDVPARSGETVRFSLLAEGLARRGVLPLAVEYRDAGGVAVAVNPGPDEPGWEVPLTDLLGVFCVMESSLRGARSQG